MDSLIYEPCKRQMWHARTIQENIFILYCGESNECKKKTSQTVEEAIVEQDTETKTVKIPKMALVGAQKGAEAAKQAVSKIASAPSRMLIVLYMAHVTEYPMGPFLLL